MTNLYYEREIILLLYVEVKLTLQEIITMEVNFSFITMKERRFLFIEPENILQTVL